MPNIIASLNDAVMLAEVKEFKVGTQKFIIGMIIKLFERSLLGSIFLRYAGIFDPSVLFELEKKLLTKLMKSLLKLMIEFNIIEPSRYEKTLSKFNSFYDDDHKTISDKFLSFRLSFTLKRLAFRNMVSYHLSSDLF